jgi:hypothetical protein
MSHNKIKVVGYAEKQVFNGNIEYRNFSDSLVGLQLTDESATFTLGNFAVTTNLDPKPSKIFTTNKFTNFVNLCNLDLTIEESTQLLSNNNDIRLKLDSTNLRNYAYFGSLLDFVRVSLEEIITMWPASLYVSPIIANTSNNLTVENFNYDTLNDETSFSVSTDVIRNQYQLNYLQNGTVINTFNSENDIRNVSVNFLKYSVLINNTEYPLLEFTGSTNPTNDSIYLNVKGMPFTGVTGTSATIEYHIKPSKIIEEEFYNSLPDFENNLLNRLTEPKYTSIYKYPIRNDSGTIMTKTKKLTWPVTDGYNIDFDTAEYLEFVADLIDISTQFDENKTNLIVRFLTAEAISDFDSIQTCEGEVVESESQRMSKNLKIYGREYDEIKRYIDGIQYANTVTYNELDNTPDGVLKYLARTLGWGMVSSILENDLLANYVTSSESTYSGMSRGYTAAEAEIEMWRRLILNSPWLWKSKGARKSVEFLFKFIGAPDGLINFNEFIYLAKDKINVDIFISLLEANGLDVDLSNYNIDFNGYPRIKNNNPDMYFQKGGLWYRETAGPNATIDIVIGNNPHIGPYDGGAAFIDQFNCLIPDFTATTITSTTVTTTSDNLFTNYISGTINEYDGDYFVNVETEEGVSLDDCVVIKTTKILDPFPTASELTDCGCEIDEDDYALLINVTCDTSPLIIDCVGKLGGEVVIDPNKGWFTFTYNTYDVNGNILPQTYSSQYASRECCRSYGGAPLFYEDYGDFVVPPNTKPPTNLGLVSCGYVCCSTDSCGCGVTCSWTLASTSLNDLVLIPQYIEPFLIFIKPNGVQSRVVPTSCSCPTRYTTPIDNITDPNTGDVGFGCKLTKEGVGDLNGVNGKYFYLKQLPNGSYIIDTFFVSVLEPTPPVGSTTSFLETLYNGMGSGNLPCNNQYMNINGTPPTTIYNNDTK